MEIEGEAGDKGDTDYDPPGAHLEIQTSAWRHSPEART